MVETIIKRDEASLRAGFVKARKQYMTNPTTLFQVSYYALYNTTPPFSILDEKDGFFKFLVYSVGVYRNKRDVNVDNSKFHLFKDNVSRVWKSNVNRVYDYGKTPLKTLSRFPSTIYDGFASDLEISELEQMNQDLFKPFVQPVFEKVFECYKRKQGRWAVPGRSDEIKILDSERIEHVTLRHLTRIDSETVRVIYEKMPNPSKKRKEIWQSYLDLIVQKLL